MKKTNLFTFVLLATFILTGCSGKSNKRNTSVNQESVSLVTSNETTVSENTSVNQGSSSLVTSNETLVSVHTHHFGDWTSVDENSHERVCECGEKETSKHSFDEGVQTKAPTCTEEGEIKYTCKVCHAEKKVVIDKLGHNLTYIAYDEEYHYKKCSHDDCDYKEEEMIPHTYVLNEDNQTYSCSCGYSCSVYNAIYHIDITHDVKFVIGKAVDFNYEVTMNCTGIVQVEGISFVINNTHYATYLNTESVIPEECLNEPVEEIHLYISLLSTTISNFDDAFNRVHIYYNGIRMTGYSSMILHSKSCPHYGIINSEDVTLPIITES